MTNLKNTKGALVSSVVALLICFSMLLGTTYAWFTDTVTSSGNILQSGNLQAAMYWANGADVITSANWNNVSADETNAIFTHTNWEPGYIDAKHIKVTNVGTLAFNYELRIVTNEVVGMLADVIDVYVINQNNGASVVDRNAIAGLEPVGTLSQVLLDSELITDKVTGSLTAPVGNEEVAEYWTIALKMQETANNDYQGKTLNNITVELVATQMASENDSFGNDYDNGALSGALPAARVTLLKDLDVSVGINSDYGDIAGNLTLDAGYQFEPTSTYEDALNSEYRYWHADFVVTADKDVPADSMALAGYYKAFCDAANNGNWVALSSSDVITAGTEIRLVDVMGEGNITVNWEALCQYGNDNIGFQCGLVDLTGENAGTTVTVELRLYEVGVQGDCDEGGGCTHPYVDCEVGEYKVIGTFTHTFPAYAVDGQDELNVAIEAGVTDISLAAGNYTMPTAAKGKTLNIFGSEGTTITAVNSHAAEGDLDYNLEGSTVTFNNVTLNIEGNNYPGYARIKSATYNNCTIVGTNFALYGESVFNHCTFNLNNGYVWTWGAKTVEFNNCTFEDVVGGKAKAILVHNTVETVVTVKDCTFIATSSATTWDEIPVAAVSIDPENGSPDATVYFEGTNTYSDAFYGLYQVKYADEVDDVTVYVNNVKDENLTAMK